jgi:hypothetical protein
VIAADFRRRARAMTDAHLLAAAKRRGRLVCGADPRQEILVPVGAK